MKKHECNFVEEQEPSGRLILGPCLICNVSAADAIKLAGEKIEKLHSSLDSIRDKALKGHAHPEMTDIEMLAFNALKDSGFYEVPDEEV